MRSLHPTPTAQEKSACPSSAADNLLTGPIDQLRSGATVVDLAFIGVTVLAFGVLAVLAKGVGRL